jgi:Zn-dependent metalloprotease
MIHSSHTSKHAPVLCVTPPYILEAIARNGTPQQQAWAERTLETTAVLKQQREAVARGEVPSGAKAMTEGPGKERYVYTADNGSTLPGRLLRSEGQPATGDLAADEAYDGSGLTYDLYWDAYQRDSIDGAGLALISTVHYQRSYDNAFWNGHQMVYGDGDEDLPAAERLFNRFTIALDIIGHELTHGVTTYEANLNYFAQPGALNESMSDVFGSLVKQRRLNQAARQADWIIGQGLFTPNVNGVGIRSMKEPGTAYDDPTLGKDPQPGHMRDYVNTIEDNGGVHINSGIPNRAFYVTAYELDGLAWEKAGRIWYQTLCDRLTNTSNFQDAANLTHQVAGELFGVNSLEQQAVLKGWSEVGIEVGGTPGERPGCLPSLLSLFRPSRRG